MKPTNTRVITIALATFIASFALFVFGIKIVLGADIDMSNMLAYLVASLVFGGVAGLLAILRSQVPMYIYMIFLGIGFIYMITTFARDLDGWADLAGLVSLFMFAGIGAVLAVVLQLILLLIKKK